MPHSVGTAVNKIDKVSTLIESLLWSVTGGVRVGERQTINRKVRECVCQMVIPGGKKEAEKEESESQERKGCHFIWNVHEDI